MKTSSRKRIRNAVSGIVITAFLALIFQACPYEGNSEDRLTRVISLYQEYKQDFQDAPEISVDELAEKLKEGKIILVDNREPEEQRVSLIPGAITDEEFERNIEKYRDAFIVVYCTIGSRSGHYTEKLRQQGIDAYNLKGGVLAWAHAGRSFVDDRGNETNRVHVYGSRWNLLPDGYEAIW